MDVGQQPQWILLIDDHPIFGLGLEMFLKEIYPDMTATRETTLAGGLSVLAGGGRQPDLVLTDLEIKNEAVGLEALAVVRKVAPQIPTVVVAGAQNPKLIREAIETGASGYIPKSSDPDELEKALNEVIAGDVYLPPIAFLNEPGPAREPPRLTPRKRDVLRGVVRGLSNKQIARELNISDETVKTHMSELYQQLNVHNRTQAVYVVARYGIRLS